MRITRINAREIIDSRGQPTVEADVFLENGVMGRASVPSGASTGSREACEQRDKDPLRYAGKGVLHAVDAIKGEINQALHNVSVVDQEQIDLCLCELDGTENKTRLGANASSVSGRGKSSCRSRRCASISLSSYRKSDGHAYTYDEYFERWGSCGQ